MCVHIGSAPYDTQFRQFAASAGKLGVRYLRDELRPSNDLGRWRTLHEQFGIRSHLLVSPATNTVAEMLAYLDALGAERISAVEGQNEGDSGWFIARPEARPDWAHAVIAYQRAVYAAVRARYPRRALPVLSPTVLDYKPADMRLLADAARYCDTVAVHAYAQGGQEPETEEAYAGLPWYRQAFALPFKPEAPVMLTEAGYHNVIGRDHSGLSAKAAAKYLPRLLLHAFGLGLSRTFIYEFMDEGRDSADPEQHYGLVSSSMEPKPAYHALRSLLGTLADPGPLFTPQDLDLEVSTTQRAVRLLSFQKRGGDVYLAVWLAARSWDSAAQQDIAAAPVRIRIAASRAFNEAASLQLGSGQGWRGLKRPGDILDILVEDTVTIVRLVP